MERGIPQVQGEHRALVALLKVEAALLRWKDWRPARSRARQEGHRVADGKKWESAFCIGGQGQWVGTGQRGQKIATQKNDACTEGRTGGKFGRRSAAGAQRGDRVSASRLAAQR